MARKGKQYRDAAAKVERRPYDIEEALGLLDLVEESQPSIAGREHFLVLRGAARAVCPCLDVHTARHG